jgi:hypothetical protein
MAFRFQIAEAHKARRPIVVLIGEVLEGSIRVGDQVSVPLASGTRFVGQVMGVLHSWPDTGSYAAVHVDEQDKPIGIGVERRDCHEAADIATGVATGANEALHLTAAALPVILVPPVPAAAAGERWRSATKHFNTTKRFP